MVRPYDQTMMKAFVLLVVGFSAGFFSGNWRAPEKKIAHAEVASCEVPRGPRLRVSTFTVVEPRNSEALPVDAQAFGLEASILESVPSTRFAHVPEDVRARFDEFLLQEIETALEFTRSKVQLARHPAGWRVHSLQPGSPLDRLALKEGDLITRVHAQDAEFRARMESVLDQLL